MSKGNNGVTATQADTQNKQTATPAVITTTVAQINSDPILIIEKDGEKYVPIKPICQAIGIADHGQRERIKEDPILGSTSQIICSVGADGRNREMLCLPYRYIFGWLFRIDSRKVSETARETVLKYQVECYNALFDHYALRSQFLDEKSNKLKEQLLIVRKLDDELGLYKRELKIAKQQLSAIESLSFEQWDTERRQLSLFPNL